MPHERLRWKVDHEKSVLLTNFERRGWARAADEEFPGSSWNVYWASPNSIKHIFNPENNIRLGDHQLVNHFPNHFELTRKDLMVKNLKRYRRELEKVLAEQREGGAPSAAERDLDCIPTTFILPGDFALLAEEFKRSPGSMWIMKPTSKSQGIGIFIVRRWSQVKRWLARRGEDMPAHKDMYVCSRYIADPLLIGGKKFDLRIYVLVLSYRPLRVFVYRRGFARFCTFDYTNDVSELDNDMVHLTNVAIQKHSGVTGGSHGWKWSLQNLLSYIEGTSGPEAAEYLMESIGWLIVHSLKAVQNVIINDKHCFECYGYDVMIDSSLKPWLLEVNACPSLSTSTSTDRLLKMQLIAEVLDLAVPRDFLEHGRGAAIMRHTPGEGGEVPARHGEFELLYDEAAETADRARKEAQERRPVGRQPSGTAAFAGGQPRRGSAAAGRGGRVGPRAPVAAGTIRPPLDR